MTIVASVWPRTFPRLPAGVERLYEVEPETRIRAWCHWQTEPQRHPTLIMVHGLEGSVESTYMLGAAEKAYAAGYNAIRLNQRNCGGSEHLTPTLYNSGLSADFRAVIAELIERDALREIFIAGYSMGGNLVLKMAGEMGAAYPPELRVVIAVSPTLELSPCVDAIDRPSNWFYQQRFMRNLRARMRRKIALYPDRYRVNGLEKLRTIREFDDAITAPHCGYRDAADYYHRASAARVIANVRVPALVITAKDDPFIPFHPFEDTAIRSNPAITLMATEHGGHCGFFSANGGDERFWAEARILEFCQAHRA